MLDVDSGEGCACVGTADVWELSIISAQFCCESQFCFALKSTVY